MHHDIQECISQGQADWAAHIGVQAYIWGLPLVECWKYRIAKVQSTDCINRFEHMRGLATRDTSKFVNSATDFLYSTAVIDLRAGPLRLFAPDFAGRWYGLQVLDQYMETIVNLGSRTFGDQLPKVILKTAAQEIPHSADQVVVESTNDYLYIVGRIYADAKEDLAPVNALQDQLLLQQLHATGDGCVDLSSSCAPLLAPGSTCPLDLRFFEELAAVLRYVRPRADEMMLIDLLAEIGITAAGFAHDSLSDAMRVGLQRGINTAQSILHNKIFEIGDLINGWKLVRNIGNYNNRYIVRALVSLHGIWANTPEESLYFMARTDSTGALLHGDNDYLIQFPAGALPPVDAFWSVSYCDAEGRLTENALSKHMINSLSNRVVPNADGSVTLTISRQLLDRDRLENWLPSHCGHFNLNLRCYSPAAELLSMNYRVPPIVRLS